MEIGKFIAGWTEIECRRRRIRAAGLELSRGEIYFAHGRAQTIWIVGAQWSMLDGKRGQNQRQSSQRAQVENYFSLRVLRFIHRETKL